jgi:hypothetical protein
MPDVYARDRPAAHGAFVIVKGVMQWDGGAIHVIAQALVAL